MSHKIVILARVIGLATLFLAELPVTNIASQSVEQADAPLTVVFDLGGVLIDTDARVCARELGLANLIRYKLFSGKPEKIKDILYTVLNECAPDCPQNSQACDPNGCPIPGLMCSWMTGQRCCKSLKKQVCSQIARNADWFDSGLEQRLVRRTARLMFDPVRFAHAQKVVTDALPLVRRCKQRGHRLVVLSNWDRESFGILRKRFANLFDLFDEIIVSGEVGSMKPEPEIFSHVTKKIPASACVFIDNQQENLDTAAKLGFHTILCRPTKARLIGSRPNLAAVEKKLIRLEAQLVTAQATSKETPTIC